MADFSSLSTRMGSRLNEILPKLAGRTGGSTPDASDTIDLSVAENKLLHEEMLQICKEAIDQQMTEAGFSYPRGFGGEPALLKALAEFFTAHFHPSVPIEPGHIITTAGAGSGLDALLYAVCDDGDSVIVPGPFWEGFGPYFKIHANVDILVASTPQLSMTMTPAVVDAIKETYLQASDPSRIKAVVITNPHNPLGQCYPPQVLRQIMDFCHEHSLHYISDEVYGLSEFDDLCTTGEKFVSALALLPKPDGTADNGGGNSALSVQNSSEVTLLDRSRVHVVWGASKDFGSSGIRLGCVISQANRGLCLALGLGSWFQVSSLASVFLTYLLASSSQLPNILELNRRRLLASYNVLTAALADWGIKFIPANAGLFLFAKIAPMAKTWDEEEEVVSKLRASGVIVSAGRKYNVAETEIGWVRITFAVPEVVMKNALERMKVSLAC
ncbi:1-aminocyclopropane-1-carboxylate synthase 7 [Lindgomyces ingoldianus]|uniref:1-aminocyclopropane-1-carboxylate synthase 7 n=1 Tax=Lindgomyces ingoldianus TaxID=673940 RepID=A0ACB6QN80_9PLEO|nr:1-aminocyclopropane-1-carboxylate synthase 7 [Lindgomyces ingoldianus]KAF2468469.1 1-aminocyclopropane-1-carboxylate synthase 7 [Lindgomyces ingoldianus]